MAKNKLSKDDISAFQIFELVQQTRTELLKEISSLRQSFQELEAGRLSRLEKDFANLQGRLTVIAILASIIISAVVKFLG